MVMKLFTFNECYISLGSNTGESCFIIQNFLDKIRKNNFIFVAGISHTYRTKAVDYKFQKMYFNLVIKIFTFFTSNQLMSCLQYLEKRHRKVFSLGKYFSRTIDADILLFNKKKILNKKKLFLPHTKMFKRYFIKNTLLNTLDVQKT